MKTFSLQFAAIADTWYVSAVFNCVVDLRSYSFVQGMEPMTSLPGGLNRLKHTNYSAFVRNHHQALQLTHFHAFWSLKALSTPRFGRSCFPVVCFVRSQTEQNEYDFNLGYAPALDYMKTNCVSSLLKLYHFTRFHRTCQKFQLRVSSKRTKADSSLGNIA